MRPVPATRLRTLFCGYYYSVWSVEIPVFLYTCECRICTRATVVVVATVVPTNTLTAQRTHTCSLTDRSSAPRTYIYDASLTFQIVTSKGEGLPVSTTPPVICSMKRFSGSFSTAGAVLSLVVFPGASGQTAWRREDPTANGLLDGEDVAEAQGTTAFGGSPRRRLQYTDDALDRYASVSVSCAVSQGGK